MAFTDSVKNRKVINDELIRYRWFAAESGYEWIPVRVPQPEFTEGRKRVRPKPESDSLLVELDRSNRRHRRYEAPADLFNRFASIEQTKEGIKAFADEFGELGFERGKGATLFHDRAVSGVNWPGELLSYWIRTVAGMRSAVALWRAIKEASNGDESALSRHVKWDASRKRVNVQLPGRQRGWREGDEAFRTFTPRGSLIRPAEEFLREELMRHLIGVLSIGLDWNEPNSKSNSQLIRSFRPNSLLALMWLQVADAVTGVTEFRPCKRKGCGKLIRISPEYGSHTNKQTCSDSCRVQVNQQRIRSVVRSFDLAKTPTEIAASSKTELSMVRKWIARDLVKRGETVATISARLFVKPGEVRTLLQTKAAKAIESPRLNQAIRKA